MAQNFDASGANDMAAIKDRITKTLSDATREMDPLETFAQVGRAAAKAATSDVTFGDALNAMNAKRTEAAKQMADFLRQEEQLGLQKEAGARAQQQLDLQGQQFGLQQQQFDQQKEMDTANLDLRRAESSRAGEQLKVSQGNLALSRERLAFDKLQAAADQGNDDAIAVIDTIKTLVPEERREIYAARLNDMPEPVNRGNVVSMIGKVRKQLEAEGGIPEDQADFGDVKDLRKQFEGLAGDFISVRDSYGTMLGLADQLGPDYNYTEPANSGPGDLSFIFAYMKMLDPTSAVREGEQATAQNARGVGGGIRNLYNQIINGAKLTPAQREGFLNQATAIYKQRQGNYDALAEGYTKIAKDYKMDPANVVLDFAGPYRYRSMSDDELIQAAEGASTDQQRQAIMSEVNRRSGGAQ